MQELNQDGIGIFKWTRWVRTAAILAAFLRIAAPCGSAEAPPDLKDPGNWKWNDPRDLKIPGLHHGTIESASMNRTVGFNIYLPPQYDREPGRRFPVVYYLHGSTGTESSDAGFANFVQAEVVAGSIDPVIYVFPNGGAESGYRDWPDGNVKAETLIIRELIPRIDADYRTIAGSGARGICGFSMGGQGALRLALKYPNLFCTAGSLAAGLEKTPDEHGGDNCYQLASKLDESQRAALFLYLVIGDEDFLFSRHGPFISHLHDLGIRYTYVVHSGVKHDLGAYSRLSARGMIEHISRELARHGGHP
jgi:endo-1,4-beta-xylanase